MFFVNESTHNSSDVLGSTNITSSMAAYTIRTPLTTEDGGNTTNGMPWPIAWVILFIVMFSLITVLSIAGNVLVCFAVLRNKSMRSSSYFFILNLAVSDILMATMCIPFTVVANIILGWWPFGFVLCPLINFIQVVSVFLSAFTLIVISVDRYVAIIFPLKARLTTKQIKMVIGIVWCCAIIPPIPLAIYNKVVLDGGKEYCYEDWKEENHRFVYGMCILGLQFFVPLTVLVYTYIRIGIVIWGKKFPGEAEYNRDQRMANSKRKMVKMMMTVVIMYIICWFPFHCITILGSVHHHEFYKHEYAQLLWVFTYWLAMSNSCCNPLIYFYMNSKFRRSFRKTFCLVFCCRRISGTNCQDSLKIRRTNTTNTNTTKEMSGSKNGAPKNNCSRLGTPGDEVAMIDLLPL